MAPPLLDVDGCYPTNGATVQTITAMKIGFTEPITNAGCSGNVTVLEVGSQNGIGFACEDITIEDSSIILNFAALSAATYMVRVDTGAVSDLAGNVVTMISSASSYTFTVGTSSEPALVIYSDPPAGGALKSAVLTFQYTLEVTASATGFVELYSCGPDFVCDSDDRLMYRFAASDLTTALGVVTVDVSMLGTTYGRWKVVIAAGTFTGGGVDSTEAIIEFVNDRSTFSPDLIVSADKTSTADGLVFTALYTGVEPGTYSLCYCSDQLDETLEEKGDGETTYKLEDDYKQTANIAAGATSGTDLLGEPLAGFECAAMCSMGCTGPNCYCEGYKTAALDGTNFCLPPSLCRDACDALGDACVGISVHDTLPQCLLASSTTLTDANVEESWQFYEKLAGTACTSLSDFTQTAGSFAVTARPDVAVDYVVTPGEDVSIEVTAAGASMLTYESSRKLLSEDRITVIDSLGTCGLSSPSSSVEMPEMDASKISSWAMLAPFSYFWDLPSEDMPGGPNQPDPNKVVLKTTAAKPNLYQPRAPGSYCKDHNMDISEIEIPFGGALLALSTHQCYTKCALNAPCEGDYCDPECDGYLSGYDDISSNALCVQEDFCKYICDNVEGCTSIDMSNAYPRCFLNSEGCANQEARSRRLKPRATPTPTPAPTMAFSYDNLPVHYSWDKMLRFKSFSFTSGGTFKVCFCDSTLLEEGSVCSSEGDFSIQVGMVHSSGVSCLLDKPALQRVSCVPQMYGGLRCYANYAAPEPVLPSPEVMFGVVDVEDMTFEELSTYCLMRPEEDVCIGVSPTPPKKKKA